MAREYIPKYIRREVWKRITSVIRDYSHLNAEYKDLKRGAANYSPVRENELRRKISALETALNNSDTETRELVRQRFINLKAYRDINLPMSESTMKRCIRRFVVEVGKNLGEIE